MKNEIDVIAPFFSTIYILPSNTERNIEFELPPNVKILTEPLKSIGIIRLLISILRNKEILLEFISIMTQFKKVKTLLSFLKRGLCMQERLNCALRKLKVQPKIYYSYWNDENALGLALDASIIFKTSRIHSWDVYEERHSPPYLPLRKFICQKLDVIYSISDHARVYAEKKWGGNIELSRIGVKSSESTKFSGSSIKTLVSISFLSPVKNIEFLIENRGIIENLGFKWIHIGDGEKLPDYQKTCSRETFIGYMKNSNIINFLSTHREEVCLINVSHFEGIPVSMMESMSFGIPCIGTETGGVKEIIEHGKNGYILPAKPDSASFEFCLQNISKLTSEELLEMRKNSFDTYYREYRAKQNYTQFAKGLLRNYLKNRLR
ncbi:glycosyltransferase [Cryomorphaceae bacterium 1068]|nr:glycosyltransferase [Cryomorphaceae bacterium 1068]